MRTFVRITKYTHIWDSIFPTFTLDELDREVTLPLDKSEEFNVDWAVDRAKQEFWKTWGSQSVLPGSHTPIEHDGGGEGGPSSHTAHSGKVTPYSRSVQFQQRRESVPNPVRHPLRSSQPLDVPLYENHFSSYTSTAQLDENLQQAEQNSSQRLSVVDEPFRALIDPPNDVDWQHPGANGLESTVVFTRADFDGPPGKRINIDEHTAGLRSRRHSISDVPLGSITRAASPVVSDPAKLDADARRFYEVEGEQGAKGGPAGTNGDDYEWNERRKHEAVDALTAMSGSSLGASSKAIGHGGGTIEAGLYSGFNRSPVDDSALFGAVKSTEEPFDENRLDGMVSLARLKQGISYLGLSSGATFLNAIRRLCTDSDIPFDGLQRQSTMQPSSRHRPSQKVEPFSHRQHNEANRKASNAYHFPSQTNDDESEFTLPPLAEILPLVDSFFSYFRRFSSNVISIL